MSDRYHCVIVLALFVAIEFIALTQHMYPHSGSGLLIWRVCYPECEITKLGRDICTMSLEDWANLVTIVGLPVAIIALIYAIIQTSLARNINHLENITKLQEKMVDIIADLQTNEDLLSYIKRADPNIDDTDLKENDTDIKKNKNRAYSMFQRVIFVYKLAILYKNKNLLPADEWKYIVNGIKEMFGYKLFVQFWEEAKKNDQEPLPLLIVTELEKIRADIKSEKRHDVQHITGGPSQP